MDGHINWDIMGSTLTLYVLCIHNFIEEKLFLKSFLSANNTKQSFTKGILNTDCKEFLEEFSWKTNIKDFPLKKNILKDICMEENLKFWEFLSQRNFTKKYTGR